jgi:adenosine deaminase CECR1
MSRKKVLSTLFLSLTALVAYSLTSCSSQNNNEPSALIDKKLEKQFALYDEAQKKIIERIVEQNTFVSREEWESWITPKPEDALDEKEIAQLTERQEQAILDSRSEAIASSTLNLDKIRNDEAQLEQYCKEVPKGALLHIHPSGTRDEETVKALLAEVNPVINGTELLAEANDGKMTLLYPEEVAFLSNLPVKKYLDYSEEEQKSILALFLLPETPPTHDFKRFEALFKIHGLLKQDKSKKQWVKEKTYLDFLKRSASLNVSYVEFTKTLSPETSTFEQLEKWAEEWYQKTGVIVRWNAAFVRTMDFDSNTQRTKDLISALENKQYTELVGIDLLANESDTPALETGQNIYIPILAANQQGTLKLHRTMHSGELGFVHNVRDAMIMGVDRVGHGVLLAQDPIALAYAVEVKNLPIEINIYSNYRLQVHEDLSTHPFLDFLRLGLPVSLSTDDEGMFISDISYECQLAISNTDITHKEFKQMSYNAIKTSFADDAVKTKLLKKLDDDFARFETKWSPILSQ